MRGRYGEDFVAGLDVVLELAVVVVDGLGGGVEDDFEAVVEDDLGWGGRYLDSAVLGVVDAGEPVDEHLGEDAPADVVEVVHERLQVVQFLPQPFREEAVRLDVEVVLSNDELGEEDGLLQRGLDVVDLRVELVLHPFADRVAQVLQVEAGDPDRGLPEHRDGAVEQVGVEADELPLDEQQRLREEVEEEDWLLPLLRLALREELDVLGGAVLQVLYVPQVHRVEPALYRLQRSEDELMGGDVEFK